MKLVRAVVGSGAGLLGLGCYCYFSGSPWFFQHVAMPAIKVLDPETAHKTSIFVASKGLLPRQRHKDPDILVRQGCLRVSCDPKSVNTIM